MNKNEQRMFMPWVIDRRHGKRRENKKYFTENLFEYLRN